MYSNPRIVIMGTPDFAVASLRALVENGFHIAAVVTAQDKPAGRGLNLTESAVKQFAISKNIPILQPEKLRSPEFLEQLKSYQADIQVVVAFRMLPEVVWAMPDLGTINRAIMNGETKTGVTTFKLQQEIDTGNILLLEEITIGPNETAGELHDHMKEIGAALVVRTIRGLLDGTLQEKPQNIQDPSTLKTAPKIFTADCEINWLNKVSNIHNQIRGLSPFPGAFTPFKDKTLKIFKARPEKKDIGLKPGEMETDGKNWLRFSAVDGYIYIEEVQMEGKKRMKTAEFLRGFRA
jgi:methionyl-tRNA formyltransferase